MAEEKQLITRDWLAIERTRLANERTFLSYFSTSVVLLGSGVSFFKLEVFSDVALLGLSLMIISPLTLLVGTFRFFRVKKNIRRYYQ
jgi:putative membrane protein